MADMKCPVCVGPYLVEFHDSARVVTLDRCPKCKGIWFDEDELNKLFESASKDLSILPGAQKTDKQCPNCGRMLYEFQYPQTLVKVDMCRKCDGVWLDPGELTELRRVREYLQNSEDFEEYAPLTGIKGGLIRMIDSAIDNLKDFS